MGANTRRAQLADAWSQRAPANVRVQSYAHSPYHSVKFELFSIVRVDQPSPFKRTMVQKYK